MSVYKHPKTGIFWTRFQHKGVEYRRSTRSRDRAAALVESRRLRVEIEAQAPSRGPDDLSLFAAMDIAEAENRGMPDAQLRALRSKWAVVLHSLPPQISVSAIDFGFICAYIKNRRAKGIRGQTIVREVQCMRRAHHTAKRRGISVSEFDWPKVKRDPQSASRTGKLWSKEQIASMLNELDQDAKDELLFAGLTGLRAAEIKRVRPEWIHETTNGHVLIMPPHATKGRTERIIALPPSAFEIVRRRIGRGTNDPFVFSQANHKKARRLASKRLGFDYVLTLRDMRHTFASVAMLRSGDLVAVQRVLGHKDLRITEKYLSSTIERAQLVGFAAESGITEVGSPKENKSDTPSKLLILKPASIGARGFEPPTLRPPVLRVESSTPELLNNATSKSPVIPGVCGELSDHQVGSPEKTGNEK